MSLSPFPIQVVVTLPVARDQRLAWPRGDAAALSSEFTPVAVASHPSG